MGVKPGTEVKFVPTDTPNLSCCGKVFTVEMHHTTHESAHAGDNVGLNVKGLAKENMPRVGDVMIDKKDDTLKQVSSFMAQVHFEPQQPFTCEGFQKCEGLGRVAILEGASVVMHGKVAAVTNGTVVKAAKK